MDTPGHPEVDLEHEVDLARRLLEVARSHPLAEDLVDLSFVAAAAMALNRAYGLDIMDGNRFAIASPFLEVDGGQFWDRKRVCLLLVGKKMIDAKGMVGAEAIVRSINLEVEAKAGGKPPQQYKWGNSNLDGYRMAGILACRDLGGRAPATIKLSDELHSHASQWLLRSCVDQPTEPSKKPRRM